MITKEKPNLFRILSFLKFSLQQYSSYKENFHQLNNGRRFLQLSFWNLEFFTYHIWNLYQLTKAYISCITCENSTNLPMHLFRGPDWYPLWHRHWYVPGKFLQSPWLQMLESAHSSMSGGINKDNYLQVFQKYLTWFWIQIRIS